MAKKRYVNTNFWTDKYIRSLRQPTGKLLYLYLFTGPLATLSGAYEVTTEQIAWDTGVPEMEVDSWLQKFEDDGKAVLRDGWLVMINTIEHQSHTTPTIRAGIINDLNRCPDWIKDRLSIRYRWLSHLNLNLNSDLNLNSKNGETPVAAVAAVDRSDDVAKDPWAAGIELLKDTMTEAQARPFLGRLAKQYSAAEMLTAIQATTDEKPADARAFLIAVLKKRGKDNARGQVGRNIPSSAADFTENCLVCFDTGSVIVKDAAGKMTGTIDCPECSKPSATSATAADGRERKAAAESAS
jgi:hypothetical protein